MLSNSALGYGILSELPWTNSTLLIKFSGIFVLAFSIILLEISMPQALPLDKIWDSCKTAKPVPHPTSKTFESGLRFRNEMDEMIRAIKRSKPQSGFKEVLIPGEPEFNTEQRRIKSGIPLDDVIWKRLMDTAESVGVDTSMYEVEKGGVVLHPSYTLKDRY